MKTYEVTVFEKESKEIIRKAVIHARERAEALKKMRKDYMHETRHVVFEAVRVNTQKISGVDSTQLV